jgi:uncharacterized protein (TIGR03437 family)
VSVTIDGVDARVIYAGPAPLSVDGLLQVNAVVPDSVSPGPAVLLILEANGVKSQPGTTISVR